MSEHLRLERYDIPDLGPSSPTIRMASDLDVLSCLFAGDM
jgi:hypothetical protein